MKPMKSLAGLQSRMGVFGKNPPHHPHHREGGVAVPTPSPPSAPGWAWGGALPAVDLLLQPLVQLL